MAEQPRTDDVPASAIPAQVIRTIDGDTFLAEINGVEELFQLAGVRAPEPIIECFAEQASQALAKLLSPGLLVWIDSDSLQRDHLDRLVGYVWIAGDSGAESVLLNAFLVQEGFAWANISQSSDKYIGQLEQAMTDAAAHRSGFWDACGGDFRILLEPLHDTVIIRPAASDCAEFSSYYEAMMYYAQNPHAQLGIDPNKDGRACEDWFTIDKTPGPSS